MAQKTKGAATVFLLKLLMTLAGFIPLVEAKTWVIQKDGNGMLSSIQAGIDSAAHFDTVLVGAGTYHENINYSGKNVVIMSVMGAQVTTIDGGSQPESCVRFVGGEQNQAILDGFTLTHGTGSPTPTQDSRYGGGILIYNSEPTIRNNVLVDNESFIPEDRPLGYGGAIWCVGTRGPGWRPQIVGNIFINNRAGSIGGAVGAVNAMAPQILNNRFIGNEVTIGDGAGIYLVVQIDGSVIDNNYFESNVAADHGGAVYVTSAHPTRSISIDISYNVFWKNIAKGQGNTGDSGGGMWLSGVNGRIHHNTIVGNSGFGGRGDWGGGIAFSLRGSPTFEQNIVAFSSKGGGIVCRGSALPIIRNNVLWENSNSQTFSSTCCDSVRQNNLLIDPQLCGLRDGNFTLAESSPALSRIPGQAGALGAGCPSRPRILETTWSRIKVWLDTHCGG